MIKELLRYCGMFVFITAFYYWRMWQNVPETKKEFLASILDGLPVLLFALFLSYVLISLGAFIVFVCREIFTKTGAAPVLSNNPKLAEAPLLSSTCNQEGTNHV